ncbi:porphyrin biosynthesis protein HemD [Paenibacillus larvae subsp. larvae]|uniref:Uroporphyrinogen-III C-methyltransferase n=1 Tax=Paenibacillus larvae subsp. larvae TaxID=147375 RepID=A0A2L1U3Z1_9BACL|nr:uroporphyrinogen-III C-methyltransferase [Paenibacillus larvae]AVF27624.1 porphyrin biosynthesis protein HemD [Paenibacillus larvae subsp. larvae]AVF32195.1 porphyrin biosynthesis protein HemD [Paenibacillus larvae subsp. larvae]MBH0344646.1 HemD protein [Paenibacillus larvae]MCY7519439.1 uroporphyrinogen-III C-methyltransferase [Paenibacillus larvae]MCY9501297.1 uroporphyrinogen-III C-methyltransferase [Paenibacillus larvae]
MGKGKVYLVGAGPGDPKLITLKGLEAIQKADVIVYDRLASPRLLKHRKPGAGTIFVGKHPDKHMMKQEDINRLLVNLALEGKIVVRLKGGDPSIFGRVGEEAEQLKEHRIPYEMIPGITSAIAVPAYAGIPVTHRDFTSTFAIVTGHEYPNKTYSKLDWEHLAKGIGTIVFLMGVANLSNICERLISHGKSPDTPAAIICMGTWMEQETITGTLRTISGKALEANFTSPAVIIIGEVVRLRDKLSWFEQKPLFGKRILVTRARSQASELAAKIEDLGGEPVEFPVISLREPSRPEAIRALEKAVSCLDLYNWILFTSVNGVDFFFEYLTKHHIDIRRLYGAKIAAVGPATADALRNRGLIPDFIPREFVAEGLLAGLEEHIRSGQHVLLPTANIARKLLEETFSRRGVHVTKVDVYENVLSTEGVEEVLELLRDGALHAVTFTSSSTVNNLLEALRQAGAVNPQELLAPLELVCIGPKTAETLHKNGFSRYRTAAEATIDSLVEALQAGAGSDSFF